MRKKVVIEAIHDQRGVVRYLEELTNLSRKNRKNPTMAEEKMWKEILMKKKTGYKFLRQKPMGRFILDFYCSELNLAIEIDGSSHCSKRGYDEARDEYLRQIGIKTLRITNEDVLNEIELLKRKINELLPSLSREG